MNPDVATDSTNAAANYCVQYSRFDKGHILNYYF